jgi:hypothetical protein
LLLAFGTAGRQERREEIVGDLTGSLWNGDRHAHVISRLINREPQKRAALGFLCHQLVNTLTHGRGIVELERQDASPMGAQPISVQLRDPRQALAIVVSAQRACDGRVISTRHADPQPASFLRRSCVKVDLQVT